MLNISYWICQTKQYTPDPDSGQLSFQSAYYRFFQARNTQPPIREQKTEVRRQITDTGNQISKFSIEGGQ